jgi:hypothetical protein
VSFNDDQAVFGRDPDAFALQDALTMRARRGTGVVDFREEGDSARSLSRGDRGFPVPGNAALKCETNLEQ